MGSSVWLWGQQPPATNAHSAVRILSPKEGEVLTTNIVRCKYELVEPASADDNPTFRLQLDDQDPVRTIIADHTFTGLKEGRHEIFVMVLDANDNPIPGTRSEVHFKVAPPQPPSSSSSSGAATEPKRSGVAHPILLRTGTEARAGQSSSASTAAPAQAASKAELPDSGSPLPLLAVLCGGALAGGTLSVLRTRGRRTRN